MTDPARASSAHPSARRRSRRAAAWAVPVVALLLAGCTTEAEPAPTDQPSASAAPTTCLESGPESDSIEVGGVFGEKPTVELPSPVTAERSQQTVVVPGDGPTTEVGDVVRVAITVFDAQSGAELSTAGYTGGSGEQLTISGDFYVPGIEGALSCAQAGSRTVTVASAADMQPGSPGTDAPNPAAIIVVDTFSIVPTRATGEAQPAERGFPEVALADDGRPTVTIPDADPPTDLRIEVLKRGDGEIVPDPANVTVQYQGVNWRTGEVFDESWGRGTVATFSTDQVVTGFAEAMIGQTVGSQVVVIVPPADGYGEEGEPGSGIEPTDTLVFVIDILAVA
ncbi:FKBP-type peptidyl-prolyl cis-trans isomerase [Frigoribacterium faeni]|uniref:FKBP-type peptidyl-prolyl cis-trans isomerase n=1 Tax=Frigoribacterium faeni TaxID=145483 RepID=UPI001FAB9560|nr:FKBP-type peptidyl-prolyl cis-trans isomerase [Frigoribacterium faeni]MCJ0701222.1 FKBP-type peptidyl-prolyl cis-trans isomerase [Frigoribacterium faeni]